MSTKNATYRSVQGSFIHYSQSPKATQMSMTRRMDRQLQYINKVEYYSAIKKEQSIVGKFHKHYENLAGGRLNLIRSLVAKLHLRAFYLLPQGLTQCLTCRGPWQTLTEWRNVCWGCGWESNQGLGLNFSKQQDSTRSSWSWLTRGHSPFLSGSCPNQIHLPPNHLLPPSLSLSVSQGGGLSIS